MSAVGRHAKSTRPSSAPSTSQPILTASTNFATICANSKATDSLSATARATLTCSPPRGFRSHCSSCSSTSACADRSPTVASTTSQTPNIGLTAASKPPTTAPTRPSKKSSTSWPQPNLSAHLSGSKSAEHERNSTPSPRIGPSTYARKIAAFCFPQISSRPCTQWHSWTGLLKHSPIKNLVKRKPDFGDERRAAPVRDQAIRVGNEINAPTWPGIWIAREDKAVFLRQVGVVVAQIEVEALVGEGYARLPVEIRR